MLTNKRLIIKSVNLVLTIGAFIFAIFYFKKLGGLIDLDKISINWWLLILSAVVYLSFYLVLSLHWVFACKIIERGVSTNQLKSFFASQPYKYLPTSLFTFSYRAIYAKKIGMGFKQSSLAQIIENINLVLSGLFISAIFYVLSIDLLYGLLTILLVTLLISALLIFDKMYTLKNISFQSKDIVKIFFTASIGWCISGLSLFFLGVAVDAHFSLVTAITANSLAFSMSILAFFAPGGIGVRELIYNTFAISSVVIVLWRLLTVVIDFVSGFLAIYWIKKTHR